MTTSNKLFLLDAFALIYRAFFALNKNPRINSKGLNTSAVLGFTNTLWEILKSENPTHIAVAFDSATPLSRKEYFMAYKAHREAMPEDLRAAIPYIIRIIEAFRIPIIQVDGFEADDIIGTMAKKAEKEEIITYMMTPDKDFGQLVSDYIYMYKPARMGDKPAILGPIEICEKYNIKHPTQLIDILGLWGDASDNIPGIPGIGEKNAIKLISEFGSLENIIQQSDSLKGKQRENIENFAAQGLLSKKLATIITDVPIALSIAELKRELPNTTELTQLFDELEFKTLGARIIDELNKGKEKSINTHTPSSKPTYYQTNLFGEMEEIVDARVLTREHLNIEEESLSNNANHENTEQDNLKTILDKTTTSYTTITTLEDINSLLLLLQESSAFCFDTETTGLDPHDVSLVGISFCVKKNEAFFVPFPADYQEAITLATLFKGIFEDEEIKKIGQNLKYDIAVLSWYDIKVNGVLFDTMIAHYLIEPEQRHNMDFLAETYLHYSPISITSLIGKKGMNQGSMRDVPLDELTAYACEDADITFQLYTVFEPLLKETNTHTLFTTIEMPLIPVLASMEAEGIALDTAYLKEYSVLLDKDITTIENEIYELAGKSFNIGSPKQLGDILFDHMRISEKPKMTKTKQYATGEDILQKLLGKHPIIEKILAYRSLSKLKSTYVDSLPSLLNQKTKRIHTSYNQAITSTGRLSSTNPNLQNIPIRTERGKEIRKAFIARNNSYRLIAADYSQIELRLLAELCKDPNMISAFKQGLDIHSATAAQIYNLPLDQITSDMRRNAKMVNFGIIYGISSFGLAERLQISRGESKEIIDTYFAKYPSIQGFIAEKIAFAKEYGYAETMLGRRRYLRDIHSQNATIRNFAERNAVNAPIQGSAADLIKIAMIKIAHAIKEKNLHARMILQVHDELIFDVPTHEVDEMKAIIQEMMCGAYPTEVPLEIEMKVATNWLEAH